MVYYHIVDADVLLNRILITLVFAICIVCIVDGGTSICWSVKLQLMLFVLQTRLGRDTVLKIFKALVCIFPGTSSGSD